MNKIPEDIKKWYAKQGKKGQKSLRDKFETEEEYKEHMSKIRKKAIKKKEEEE